MYSVEGERGGDRERKRGGEREGGERESKGQTIATAVIASVLIHHDLLFEESIFFVLSLPFRRSILLGTGFRAV